MQLVRERLVGSVGASPHQEKSPDELQPSDRERAIPDLHPEKSRPLPSRYCREAGAPPLYNHSGAASQ